MSLLELPTPFWVEPLARDIKGQDLLGLRNSAQNVGNVMLDGITSVTPSVRYLSLHAWIPYTYERLGLPASASSFNAATKAFEAAFALVNASRNPNVAGVVGARSAKAISRLEEELDEIELEAYTKNTAYSTYESAARDLRLAAPNPNAPISSAYTEPFGRELAEIVDASFSEYPFDEWLSPNFDVSIPTEELSTYHDVLNVEQLPRDERDYLLGLLVPTGARAERMSEGQGVAGAHRRRAATYGLILDLAKALGKPPTEKDFYEEVGSATPHSDTSLSFIRDGWMLFLIRDAIAVTHEVCLEHALELLKELSYGERYVPREAVIERMLSDEDDSRKLLERFGIDLGAQELWSAPFDLFIKTVASALEEQTSPTRGALRRWDTNLSEDALCTVARSQRHCSPMLALLSWVIARERLGEVPPPRYARLLSRQGHERAGFEQIITRQLLKWSREGTPVSQVLAEMIVYIMTQHAHIAASRLSQGTDVSRFLQDRETWCFRKPFVAGRTLSRIPEAISWMKQLECMDGGGITDLGKEVLTRALELSEGGAL